MGIRISVGRDADVLVFLVVLVFKEIGCGCHQSIQIAQLFFMNADANLGLKT